MLRTGCGRYPFPTMSFLRRALALVLSALLCGPLSATWSIILIDLRTGEIAVGCATCLTGFDLRQGVPVILVGVGAGCAQSSVDATGQNRLLIRNQLLAGTSPSQILVLLAQQDPGHQTRQYGIVDTQGRAVGFTGNSAGAYAGHITGQVGQIVYAIQGNVITGAPVLLAAEAAVRTTVGDLPEKLMAGMEAARLMGGDGRCSCPGTPTSCGSPPASFQKSSHIAFMIVARPGDTDGAQCNATVGCATGNYYFNVNVANQPVAAPDPVFQLQTSFLNWRLQNVLRPDHFTSEVTLDPPTLPADGQTQGLGRVVLRDWRGARVPFGGAQVTVANDPSGSAPVLPGPVIDRGDGSYTFPVLAGTQAGTARLRVTVDDGFGARRLGPPLAIPVRTDPLWSSRDRLGAAAGGQADFVLQGGPSRAGRGYLLLASASGSAPGVTVAPGVVLPLNPDPVLFWTLDLAVQGLLPGFLGLLDGQGRQRASLAVPPGVVSFLQGGTLTFAYALLDPVDFASNPVPVSILP
jgi:hypothetical protein